MSFSSEYNFPVFIGTGSVLTSGGTEKLSAGQLGLFNAKTSQAVSGPLLDQAVIIASGSWHKKDKLNKFVGGLKESDKTIPFKKVFEFHRSAPRVGRSEQWALGWDGVGSDTLSFEKGKSYTYKVRVFGEDVYGTFLRPVDRFITFKADCPDQDECADGCDDGVACKYYAKKIADIINNDPELQYFVQAEAISSDYAVTTPTHNVFNLSVVDAGDQAALSAVQDAYPTLQVTRISRVGLTSTYEVCVTIGYGTPTTFTATSSISLAACDGTCPAGYTATYSKDIYVVTRPLAGTEDLVGNTAKQTYADVVKLSYFPVHTFNGASAVDPTTNQITVTAHGFAANTPVLYSNGGGTSIVGLTTATVYYIKTVVDANNVTLSATPGGTVIDITADGVGASHTLTISASAAFLSQDGAVARIQFKVDAPTVDLAAILSDSLEKVAVSEAICTPPTASAVAWSDVGDRYKTSRTLHLTLEKICGTATRLAELQAFYATHPNIVADSLVLSTSGTCSDIYAIQQYNNDCLLDGCLAKAVAEYDTLQSFEGFTWVETPETAGAADSVKCGVRITASYEDTRFGGCSFNPSDYYSVRPLKLEVSEFDDSGNACHTPVASRKIRNVSMPTQSGEYVIRQFINSNKYRAYGAFYSDPRLREALDAEIHQVVDRDKTYKLYYLKVQQDREGQNHVSNYSPEIFEFMFAFPIDVNTTTFEQTIEKFTSQFGVYLKDR